MLNYIKKSINRNEVKFLILVSIAALLIRCMFLWIESSDYTIYLSEWCRHLKENGGFKGIVTVNADYNAIYLYFLAAFTYLPFKYLYPIKFLSIIFDYVLAIGAYKIIGEFYSDKDEKKLYSTIGYIAVLFMPTVILNSSMWGQCDSIYAALIIFSFYYMIKKDYNICFILFGAALTFKLQAIFFLPVYGIIYLKNRDFSILKFFWIPLVNVVLYIPAVIIGKPITSVFDAYFTQVSNYDYKTVYGYPNLYNFMPLDWTQLIIPGIIVTMILLFILMVIVLCTKNKIHRNDMIRLAIPVVLIVTYFLPKMHDRYGFVAEVLVVIYFVISRKNLSMALIVNICMFVVYCTCLFGLTDKVTPLIAIVEIIPLSFYSYDFIKSRVSAA